MTTPTHKTPPEEAHSISQDGYANTRVVKVNVVYETIAIKVPYSVTYETAVIKAPYYIPDPTKTP
jgi:hypothetical protein